MRILTALAMALMLAGCTDSGSGTPSLDEEAATDSSGVGNMTVWRVTYLAREMFTLASAQQESFDVEVPAGAGEVLVAITPHGGAYVGTISIAGLGDCDDTTNFDGTAVDLGQHNGAGYGTCLLDVGTYTVTVSIDSGSARFDVDVLTALPSE